MKTIKLVLVMLFGIAIASCGGGGGSSTPPSTPPCASVPGVALLNIGSTSGGTFWSTVGSTQLGFNNTNLNFYPYVTGDWIADMGAVCLGDVTAWPTSGSAPVAYVQDHVYVVEYQVLQSGAPTGIKSHYKFVAGAYSQGSVAITWIPMFGATASTTIVQNLMVGTAMTSFSPLTANYGATPYTYSYTGTLPAGLSYNTSTGVMSGTPTAPYPTANLVFSVRDANNVVASATSTVSFTVIIPPTYVVQGGLTWMPAMAAAPSLTSAQWTNANSYCTTTTINGLTGWRLPTQLELSALYTSGAMNGMGWKLGLTWSSTPYIGLGSYYAVDLTSGISYGGSGFLLAPYVTCVR